MTDPNNPVIPNNLDVLLVEDNPNDAELTLTALKKHNLANKVFHVTDGTQALDFLFGKGEFSSNNTPMHPKLVLLDLKLPKVDGLEVLAKIRQNEATKHLPVVILTSSKEERDIIESYRLGVNSYIVKPVEFDNFMSAVAELGLYWLILNQYPTDKI